MTTWTEAQIDRHLHLWEHRHGPDSPEAGIVRQLRAERDAAWRDAGIAAAYKLEKRAEEIVQKHLPASAFNELRDAAQYCRAALPTTKDTPHD